MAMQEAHEIIESVEHGAELNATRHIRRVSADLIDKDLRLQDRISQSFDVWLWYSSRSARPAGDGDGTKFSTSERYHLFRG